MKSDDSSVEKTERTAAKLADLKTKTNNVVTEFGESWLPALEAEFQKPYFSKVSSQFFLAYLAVDTCGINILKLISIDVAGVTSSLDHAVFVSFVNLW